LKKKINGDTLLWIDFSRASRGCRTKTMAIFARQLGGRASYN